MNIQKPSLVPVSKVTLAILVWARSLVLILITLIVATSLTSAADLRGKVINGTTKKVQPGDNVVLLSPSNDQMSETSRTTTDKSGSFRISVPDPDAIHVLRIIHQGVTYHQRLEPGRNSLNVEVYDVASQTYDVTAVMDVERFEATGDQLEVKELVTMRNRSNPPRTLLKDRSFEFQLPPDAKVQYGLLQFEDGQPLKQDPIPGDHPGQYYFAFPMRPGDTRFAVVYRVPYDGQAMIQPAIRNASERFVVMMPSSMRFEPSDPRMFQPMEEAIPDNMQGTGPVALNQNVSFRISGAGMLAELAGRRQSAKERKTVASKSIERPGGGLGPPIQAPDPLEKYRWPILYGLTAALVAGAVFVAVRGRRVSLPTEYQPVLHKTVARRHRSQPQSFFAISRRNRHRRSSTAETSLH